MTAALDVSGAHKPIESAPRDPRKLIFATERRGQRSRPFTCSVCNTGGLRKGVRVSVPAGTYHLVCNHCVRLMHRRCCR